MIKALLILGFFVGCASITPFQKKTLDRYDKCVVRLVKQGTLKAKAELICERTVKFRDHRR